MQEQGTVSKVLSPGRVEVSLPRAEGCARCGVCRGHHADQVYLEALGPADLRGGERVEIELSSTQAITAGLVVYLLPVLMLLIGYGCGAALTAILPVGVASETAGMVGALSFLAGSFAVVRWYDRKARHSVRWQARVTRVLP